MWKSIKKLQSAPEHIKQRWLLGTSALAMIFVLFLWLAYFNTLLEPLGSSTSRARSESESREDSAWDTMQLGVRFTFTKLKNGVLFLVGAFQAPRDYIIEP